MRPIGAGSRRRATALSVGLVIAAWASALGAIAGLRPAALYRQWSGEGMMFFWVDVLWLVSWLCGLAAVWIGMSYTPSHRLGRRVLIGVALLGPVLASVLGIYVSQLDLSHCWRTCSPFPR